MWAIICPGASTHEFVGRRAVLTATHLLSPATVGHTVRLHGVYRFALCDNICHIPVARHLRQIWFEEDSVYHAPQE